VREANKEVMSFRTSLFDALRVADHIICNGKPVVAKMLETGGLLDPFVDLPDETIYIDDCELQIDSTGLAYALDKGLVIPLVWHFYVTRPLGASDVPVVNPPKLTVADLVKRNAFGDRR
jgi:hypothetical protein